MQKTYGIDHTVAAVFLVRRRLQWEDDQDQGGVGLDMVGCQVGGKLPPLPDDDRIAL